jgi:hypothetical protein
MRMKMKNKIENKIEKRNGLHHLAFVARVGSCIPVCRCPWCSSSLVFIVPCVHHCVHCPPATCHHPRHSSLPFVLPGIRQWCSCSLSWLFVAAAVPMECHPGCSLSPVCGYHHYQHLQFNVAVVVADVAGGRVGLASCCRVRTEPIAALRAEAHSGGIGHEGKERAWVCLLLGGWCLYQKQVSKINKSNIKKNIPWGPNDAGCRLGLLLFACWFAWLWLWTRVVMRHQLMVVWLFVITNKHVQLRQTCTTTLKIHKPRPPT